MSGKSWGVKLLLAAAVAVGLLQVGAVSRRSARLGRRINGGRFRDGFRGVHGRLQHCSKAGVSQITRYRAV